MSIRKEWGDRREDCEVKEERWRLKTEGGNIFIVSSQMFMEFDI